MKASEAPPVGWYPDPEGGVRLRWWDGTDWTDSYRSRPSPGELLARGRAGMAQPGPSAPSPDEVIGSSRYEMGGLARRDAEEILSQVRQVARSEVDRAADLFTQRARAVTSEIQPLVSRYTSRIVRWLRIALVVAVVLVGAWIAFQIFAQVSLFEWIGDRIDSLTDE